MKARNNGFTLIEVLVVIGLIAILMAVLIPRFSRSMAVSQETQAQSLSSSVYQAINNRLLQNTSLTAKQVLETELKLPVASPGSLPTLYTRFPGGTLYNCGVGAYLNSAVQWPSASPGIVCIVDVDASGEFYHAITYVEGHQRTHYVDGQLVAK